MRHSLELFRSLDPNGDLIRTSRYYLCIRQTAIMDSDAVKKTIIKQALQATNTANARTLIEVGQLFYPSTLDRSRFVLISY